MFEHPLIIILSWKKLDANCNLSLSITHNPHELWFVYISNLDQKPKLGCGKEKVNEEIQRSPLLPMVLRKMKPLRTKKIREKEEKNQKD